MNTSLYISRIYWILQDITRIYCILHFITRIYCIPEYNKYCTTYPVSKFKEFKLHLKSPKNRFQLSAGLIFNNLIQFKVEPTILDPRIKFKPGNGSKSLNSTSDYIEYPAILQKNIEYSAVLQKIYWILHYIEEYVEYSTILMNMLNTPLY